jgi:hypothetical protein
MAVRGERVTSPGFIPSFILEKTTKEENGQLAPIPLWGTAVNSQEQQRKAKGPYWKARERKKEVLYINTYQIHS